ncbi:quinol oxidase subunit 2 [Thalassobacillus devorans]|uniref:Quinol oxidase subunit 2 n=1 Tax=Thalassobacillus devorans TaxID=279813 RepID=A0ABQ1PRX2_9BACI|nr:cytochrome aa3 quinol oxidase subunit II [Thalassobacillus devorans]NIK30498.1 cytochrome aa3-600 menaquinol oxidase subunit 2 [Thalassobacillus devorans]GGD02430.1 quinol oxidase subunit 2 [Thalassobacillus devorans]
MRHKRPHLQKWLALLPLSLVFLLSGCSELTVLDPKGPVGQSQKDLIVFSLWFMLGIVVVVFALFAFMVIKYRNRPGRNDKDYDPDLHGNTAIEIVWTVIPLIIVIILSVPTVTTLFDLEKPPESSSDKEPLVIYATSADWKWFFSYPEQDIETVNYLHIPTDRAIEFRLSSADSMAALWIPQLGGQKYNMAGMENTLYLQADEPGTYDGRNGNFNGEGFTEQTFKVHAQEEEEFNDWVQETQDEAPELTQEEYDELLAPSVMDEQMTFSNTHLGWVDHGTNDGRDYAIKRHRDAYQELLHLENEIKGDDKHE